MHPVAPRTIVRGPAALTMSFMTRADSQPWQVRWPEVKYSSRVTLLTPRKGSRVCVMFAKASAMLVSLFPYAEPLRLERGLAGGRRLEAEVRGLVHVFERHLTASEAADEGQQRRPLSSIVHGRPDLVGDDARAEGRAEGVVAVDDPDGLGALQSGDHLLRGERAEPAGPDQADLLALGAHVADSDLEGQRDRPHTHQDDVGVLRHVLLEPWVLRSAPEDLAKIRVGLLDDRVGPTHRLVVLAADFDDPIFVGLRSDGDGVVRMEKEIAAIVARKELVHLGPTRHLDDGLRVRQEGTVRRDGAGQEDPAVLRDAIGEERGVQHLLGGVDPDEHPAEVTHHEGVVVLHAESAWVVEGAEHNDALVVRDLGWMLI